MKKRPRPRRRRALVGVLSIAFVLLPAAGIAYFGAISYQEDRGLVAEKLDEHYQAAVALASAVEVEITRTLDQLGRLEQQVSGRRALLALQTSHPLAAFPFVIDASGRLLFPAIEPLRKQRSDRDDFLSRVPRTCPERGFDTCIQAIRAAQRRLRQLQQARRRELGSCTEAATCSPSAKDLDAARRAFVTLTRYDDTGPDALLGLARLASRAGQTDESDTHYKLLSKRFGNRLDADGVSYRLLADLGRADARGQPDDMLDVYRSLLAPTYEAPHILLEQVARRVRERIDRDALSQAARRELDDLDAALAEGRRQAVFAAALASEIADIARTASAIVRGRPALSSPERTILYRQQPSGRVIGIVIDRAMLEHAARGDRAVLQSTTPDVRVVVERPGDAADRARHTRTLASSSFGSTLPHLSLALVHDRDRPDPLDEIIESRGRRHLAITGGLVVLLVIGLLATIRSAARERELARLKSDFVSTVSHELKTPLTSIRMFGEMLQQGVAGDDRARQQRYHEIIVKESQRLGLLIANLLDYSQIERGTRRYSRQPTRAADIARDAVETFERFRQEPAGIQLQVAHDDHDSHADVVPGEPSAAAEAEILVDREVLVQSLLNLLGNAVKYGAPPIEVCVSVIGGRASANALGPSEQTVRISVTDHGPGIQASERERIFQEFYRAPDAYSSGVEGTGLGLALVKRHVLAQGGDVFVDSEPGRGATFTIQFPHC